MSTWPLKLPRPAHNHAASNDAFPSIRVLWRQLTGIGASRFHLDQTGTRMSVADEAVGCRRAARVTQRMRQGGSFESGCGMATTSSPSIPVKSLGLQVYTGKPLATAVAAIMAS